MDANAGSYKHVSDCADECRASATCKYFQWRATPKTAARYEDRYGGECLESRAKEAECLDAGWRDDDNNDFYVVSCSPPPLP